MNILRRLGLALLAAILFFCLLGTAWSHIGLATLGSRNTVKGWLNDSGFYDRIVDSVLENVNQDNAENDKQQIPVDDPQVQAIAAQAFSPAFLRENIEKVLDGTYAWLDGETAKPEFAVDLSGAKQQLADGIGNYAISRAQGLPACTAEQTQELAASGEFDILNAPCVPPGVDIQAVGADLRNQIISSEDFLKDTEITGDDIKIDDNGQETSLSETEQFDALRDGYRLARLGPIILGVVAALSAVGIIFLSSSKRAGVRRAGVVFLTAGIILGISYAGFRASSGWLNNKAVDLGGDSTTSKELLRDAIGVISQDISSLLLWYSIGVAAIGVTCIVLGSVLGKPKQGNGEPADTVPTPPVDDSPKVDPAGKPGEPAPEKPADKPKRKEPRKIQL